MLGALRPSSTAAGRIARILSSNTLRTSISSSRQAAPVRKLILPRAGVRQFHRSSWKLQQHAEAVREVEVDGDAASNPILSKFDELSERGLVHNSVVRAITEGMKLTDMTEVQGLTLTETLQGVDTFAQAKTGTGKTIAFLIPTLNNILKALPELASPRNRNRASATDVRAIIVSPTRELAEQIAVEAKRVVQQTGIVVQTATGGTQKREAMMKMQREGCHLLVATPGRLKDLLTSEQRSSVRAPALNTLVLDEADRLLDQGFLPDIEEIISLLPDRRECDRQTLMFSATIQKEVMHLVRDNMKINYRFVETVHKGEEPTHKRVPQKMVHVAGLENMLPALLELCTREVVTTSAAVDAAAKAATKADDEGVERPEPIPEPFKAIVYFNSTLNVKLAAAAFHNLHSSGGDSVRSAFDAVRFYEMHARLNQHQRTTTSNHFRSAKTAIMFSSDVTSRGMDFPGVTHIIQMGVPNTFDDYIHRLGRTARANKEGQGWLLLPDLERDMARIRLRGLPLKRDESLLSATVDMGQPANLPQQAASALTDMTKALGRVGRDLKTDAWISLLGIYQFVKDKRKLLEVMSNLTKYGWGWDKPPAVPGRLAQKLGLSRTMGIEIMQGSYTDRGSRGRSEQGFDRPRPFHQRGRDARRTPGRYDDDRGYSTPYSERHQDRRSGDFDYRRKPGADDGRGGGGNRRYDGQERSERPTSRSSFQNF